MKTKDFKKKIQQQIQKDKEKVMKGYVYVAEGNITVISSVGYKAYVDWGSSHITNLEKKYTCDCLQDIGLEDLGQGEELMLSKLCDSVVDLKVSTIQHNNIYINLI